MVFIVGKATHIELMPSTAANKVVQSTAENGSLRAMDGDATATEKEGGYRAKRYAVKYEPPCIFLEYEDTSKKRRVRAVKLNEIQDNVDVDRLTRKVIRSFPRRLEPTSVKYDQVRKLVVKLVEFLGTSNGGGAAVRNLAPLGPSRLGPGGGSSSHDGGAAAPGRLSDGSGCDSANGSFSSPLPTMSPRMDPRGPTGRLGLAGVAASLSNQHRGSVESTMSRFSTSTACSSRSSSEEGGDGEGLASALDELEKEMGAAGSTSICANCSGGSSELDSRDSSFSFRDRPTIAATTATSLAGPGAMAAAVAGAAAAKSRFAAEAEKLVIGLEVTEDLDLNRVTELELKMAKMAMEENFRKNQLRPGDEGYEYDKQEEFGPPTLDNDWDESGDEEEPSDEPEVDWADIHAAIRKPGSAAPVTTVQVHAGGSSGDESTSLGRSKNGHSPYNSNDWP